MQNFGVTIRGLKALDDLKDLPKKSQIAAGRAINKTLRDARAKSGRQLRQEVAFPARYLTGQDGKIEQFSASSSNLEGKLRAASRPTGLARFVTNPSAKRGKIKVEVQPGGQRLLPGAFMLGLGKAGGEATMLAVRSPGKPSGAYRPRRLGKSLWLLYGPSVAQALLGANGRKGIWPDMEDEIANALEAEYLRQMNLEIGK